MSDPTTKPRTGPGLRIRCPFDDGTDQHTATDVHGPFSIAAISLLTKALGRCACGREALVLDGRAREPKDHPEDYEHSRAALKGKARR
jgi:hypothetical protein